MSQATMKEPPTYTRACAVSADPNTCEENRAVDHLMGGLEEAILTFGVTYPDQSVSVMVETTVAPLSGRRRTLDV